VKPCPFKDILGGHLGIDPTYILISLGSLWAMNKLWNQLYTRLYALAQQ
jgi:chaperone BCS1